MFIVCASSSVTLMTSTPSLFFFLIFFVMSTDFIISDFVFLWIKTWNFLRHLYACLCHSARCMHLSKWLNVAALRKWQGWTFGLKYVCVLVQKHTTVIFSALTLISLFIQMYTMQYQVHQFKCSTDSVNWACSDMPYLQCIGADVCV